MQGRNLTGFLRVRTAARTRQPKPGEAAREHAPPWLRN